MFTLAFWKAAAERAVKTGAQSILTAYFVGDVALNAIDADWVNMGGIGLGGVVLSVLTSLASGYKDGNPSVTNAEIVTNK